MEEQAKQLFEYISDLKPVKIQPKNVDNSLYEQIKQNTKKVKDNQSQFNFNVGEEFDDPIDAAEYLLKREYGKTFLFKPGEHEAIFIPTEFVSNQL